MTYKTTYMVENVKLGERRIATEQIKQTNLTKTKWQSGTSYQVNALLGCIEDSQVHSLYEQRSPELTQKVAAHRPTAEINCFLQCRTSADLRPRYVSCLSVLMQ